MIAVPTEAERKVLVRIAVLLAALGTGPVMLDFYADWCVSCEEMESFTFGDAQGREIKGLRVIGDRMPIAF